MLETIKITFLALTILIFIGLGIFIVNSLSKSAKTKKDIRETILSIIILGILCYIWVFALNCIIP